MMARKGVGALLILLGIGLIVLAFYLGCGVLDYKWWEVPMTIILVHVYSNLWATVLSYMLDVFFYGGVIVAIVGVGLFATKS